MAKLNVIYTSDFDTDNYVGSFAEERGITIEEARHEHENDLYTYCFEEKDHEFDCLMDEIKYYEEKHGKKTYLVLADIDTWQGIVHGGKLIEGMKEVIATCLEDENFIFFEGRTLKINAIHHDGRNTFTIKELTDEGERYVDNHWGEMTTADLRKKLFEDRHLTRHVRIFNEIYGA